ncbi:MAG: type I restriction-modification system subunit M [Chitinispirillales bacterium]|jgi:type I restriction enzyme M protein|nr:type I restriction-modification system subunit M [Chitinispirillales bacterium]
MAESNIGQKIWSMANALRDDGIGKSDYLEQLTYLLFVKMADEYSKPPYKRNIGIPSNCTWNTLKNRSGNELFEHYEHILKTLAKQKGTLQQIYTGAQNKISNPALLAKVIGMVDAEKWSSMSSDVKGDIYEDLLEKIAADTKSGAGQYFTPRALINAMVRCVQPKPNKTIADPCCGSGGFLLAAKSFLEKNYTMNADEKKFLKFKMFKGWEIVPSTYRLCLMNLFLHNISDFEGTPPIAIADSLVADPGDRFDCILTNPPFGKKSSITFTNEQGEQEQEDLVYNRQDFWATTSNKQLNFVQHIHTLLKTDGTAAIVVPDNVLFEGGAGETIRRKLLQTTDLHTILRLPTGIFYAQGVKANVIFFDNRAASPKHRTKEVWIYDYRTNIKLTLKKNPLRETDLDDFVKCYNPKDRRRRKETYGADNPEGRWRKFTYDEIIARDKTSLDITWLKSGDNTDDQTLAELLNLIKEKSSAIAAAVGNLETLIGEVDE